MRRSPHPDLTLPTLLTLGRIAATPVIVGLLLCPAGGARWAALALFLTAAATDWLDGWLARSRGLESALGRMLDPIADKILTGAVLLGLAAGGRLTPLGIMAAVLILAREFAVSGLREYTGSRGGALPVTRLAKWKTACQMAAIAVLIVAPPLGHQPVPSQSLPPGAGPLGTALLGVAAVLTLVTGWGYLRQALAVMAAESHATIQDASVPDPP